MKKFAVILFSTFIILSAFSSCGKPSEEKSGAKKEITVLKAVTADGVSGDLKGLRLQLKLSRKEYFGSDSEDAEARRAIEEAGRKAAEVALDPGSTPEEMNSARKALKDATAEFKSAHATEDDMIRLGETINAAEAKLADGQLGNEAREKLSETLREAYSAYRSQLMKEVNAAYLSLKDLI